MAPGRAGGPQLVRTRGRHAATAEPSGNIPVRMTERVRREMDPRLRRAVDLSVGWYDDICALHGVGSILADGVWSALDTPPPLHSDAVVVEPAVTADRVLVRLNGRAHCGVKDSFARMDLSGEGMVLLFSATLDTPRGRAVAGTQCASRVGRRDLRG